MNQIGLIGLAVMGQNLARNFASRRIKTVVYNRTSSKTETFIKAFGNEHLVGETELEQFVQAIERPRKIIVMVQAGKAVDAVIDSLLPFLESGDIIIDGGNSHYPDTKRRKEMLGARELHFVGCGISGGEEGALNGPSLMPGGDKLAVDALLPLLEKIAAKDFAGKPCVTNVGSDGSGHFVKMVHNGIEYAVMQFLAEAYDLMRAEGKSPPQIAAVFEKWNQGKLASFLVELSGTILQKKDDHGDGYLIDKILDVAGQKGTGRWTVVDAVSRGVAMPTISAAVDARIFSAHKPLRTELDGKILRQTAAPKLDEATLEQALYLAMITAYAEGFALITAAAQEEDWEVDRAELARIWQGGCIIRAELLQFLEHSFRDQAESDSLLAIPEIIAATNETIGGLKKSVLAGIESGIPLPGLTAALTHIGQLSRASGSANFIQGLRDAFGAHTFARTDQDGVFHAEWSQ